MSYLSIETSLDNYKMQMRGNSIPNTNKISLYRSKEKSISIIPPYFNSRGVNLVNC